jgi:hypothetical protein
VSSGTVAGGAFRQTLRAGRLQKLRRLGLAEETVPGRWQLAPTSSRCCAAMGERGDIFKTMHRELAREGVARGAADLAVYDPTSRHERELIGRVMRHGLSDELDDGHCLIVDGIDGRAHYVDIGRADADPPAVGGIVAIEAKPTEPKEADHTVVEIAAVHGYRHSVDIHLEHDRTAHVAFAEAHVRRLEALRRAGAGIEREADGTWIIAPDHLERAAAYERMQAQASPVTVRSLSVLPLDRQVGAEGATWLDRELLADAPTVTRDAGFGRQVRDALARRRQSLVEQELARREQDQIIYRSNLLAVLRLRELAGTGAQLSGELSLRHVEMDPYDRIEGIYHRRLELVSARFAVIEKSREFTLVPQRPVLECNLGREVSGIARGDTISWTLGRQRSGPSIE